MARGPTMPAMLDVRQPGNLAREQWPESGKIAKCSRKAFSVPEREEAIRGLTQSVSTLVSDHGAVVGPLVKKKKKGVFRRRFVKEQETMMSGDIGDTCRCGVVWCGAM